MKTCLVFVVLAMVMLGVCWAQGPRSEKFEINVTECPPPGDQRVIEIFCGRFINKDDCLRTCEYIEQGTPRTTPLPKPKHSFRCPSSTVAASHYCQSKHVDQTEYDKCAQACIQTLNSR